MGAPSVNDSPGMFCRKCGYALVGLPSNRCPECGHEFNPANHKTFRTHPPPCFLHRLIQIGLIFFCLSLPLDSYIGYLAWQRHLESQAIQLLRTYGAIVHVINLPPKWAKVVFRGHAAWLWGQTFSVELYWPMPYDHKMQIMDNVAKLKSLERFTASYLPVTDSDLAQIKDLKALQWLSVNDDLKLTDRGLSYIKGLTSLQNLDLCGTDVTDAGLSHINGLTSLQNLYLDRTHVTNLGLSYIKGLTSLQDLCLYGTHVTDAGLVQLKGLKALRHIDLQRTNVTNAGVADLRIALPNCQIDH